MTTWTFGSSSGAGEYTATLADDGKLLCNCRGWTMRKLNQPRMCKHLRQIISEHQLTVDTRGEFVFSTSASAVPAAAVAPTPFVANLAQTFAPMLASAPPQSVKGEAFDQAYREGWALEEKLDGHRVIVINDGRTVTAFSRPRAGGTGANARQLPPPIVALLESMTPGVYDGELVVPGGTSSDVVIKGAALVLVLFDVLALRDQRLINGPYSTRRAQLLDQLRHLPKRQQLISTVESVRPRWVHVEAIWKRGGEGAILKRLGSPYRPGYRSPDWLKVKAQAHATLRLVGFEVGKSGPYSTLRLLEESSGITTTVKTLGNAMLAEVSANPQAYVGRRVVITYQQRTASGTFRHGIFDHFAGEGE